ncbi:MAG: hypothetical protein Kow0032_29680 [Methyloligellaceae bacterium]
MAAGFDCLLHLAVLNNTAEADDAEFERVNVTFFADILSKARDAGVKRIINVTTFHALDGRGSAYARSKRKALQLARAQTDLEIVNLFLPAVYGDQFAGRLAILNRVPKPLQRPFLTFLSALAPTVHIDRLAEFLLRHDPKCAAEADVFLANPQMDNLVYRSASRLIDLSFALAVIMLFWWLLFIIWILIRLETNGPGIFSQERVGQNGKPFVCYKFRTMKTGTRQAGTHEVEADSITRVGAFLRKTKIDELPQVWNILRGELGLVGPRPCLPVQHQLIRERQKRGVLTVKPGITGLAQINGIDMSDPALLAWWDARYIALQCLPLDLKIIVATFLGRGQGDKIRQ